MAERLPWMRDVYLYLAAFLGLVLASIGGVRLADLGLRSWIFTHADQEERLHYMQPPPIAIERVQRLETGDAELSAQEREAVRQWLTEYRQWEERRQGIDPILARRQRTAASSLALILIGLPLYLYHWGLIRRERRRPAPEAARA